LTGGSLAITAGLAVLAAAPDLAVALIGAALAGVANGMLSTAFMTETQDRTPRDWMTLVTTLLQSIRQISPGLGILLGGVLAAAGSARLAFGVAGAGCLLFAGATFVLMAPKRLGRGGEGHEARHEFATDRAASLSGGAPAGVVAPDVVAHKPTSTSEMTIGR
jgi:MFS family permease